MKTSNVAEVGLTVLYEPEDEDPEVDIIFIHGLQGHPKNTWLWSEGKTDDTSTPTDKSKRPSFLQKSFTKVFHRKRPDPRNTGETSLKGSKEDTSHIDSNSENATYWPVDLLPDECPHARIITWGYDSRVTRGYVATNKSNIFGHAKDFLYAYERNHPIDRGVIFVAHSLGGLIVKEVLRRSESSEESEIRNIIHHTKAVVFLGTPHRGSPGFASTADVVRRVASTILRFDSNDSIIRALGVDSPELELSRESFITQWRKLQFTVKTFQEARPITGVGVGLLNDKVVPDTSSTLDDPREHAETIQANHMDMCKYSSRHDPGYQKVGLELARLAKGKSVDPTLQTRPLLPTPQVTRDVNQPMTDESNHEGIDKITIQGCMKSLKFDGMLHREHTIQAPLASTCRWLFKHPTYTSWERRDDVQKNHGMVWLKGVPGSGKSTIMKEIVGHAIKDTNQPRIVARVYFNARGSVLEHTYLGMLRSILVQLLQQSNSFQSPIIDHYVAAKPTDRSEWIPGVDELRELTRRCLIDTDYQARITICVDALDECDENQARETASFLREITDAAFGTGKVLDVCISSRHYPHITIPNCPDIVMEKGNTDDIEQFVKLKIPFEIMDDHFAVDQLRSRIIEKSKGIFLWVVLVVNIVRRDLDNGRSEADIQAGIAQVPTDLVTLYTHLLKDMPTDDRKRFQNLVYWLLLENRELGLESIPTLETLGAECCHIPDEPYTQINLPLSPRGNDDAGRLEKLLRSLSRGLIEYSGERLQFIHESVREFIIQNGYTVFRCPSNDIFWAIGHCTIIQFYARVEAFKSDDSERAVRVQEFTWMSAYGGKKIGEHATKGLVYNTFPLKIRYLAVTQSFNSRIQRWYENTYRWNIIRELDRSCSDTIQQLSSKSPNQAPETELSRMLRSFPYRKREIFSKLTPKNWTLKIEQFREEQRQHLSQLFDSSWESCESQTINFRDNEDNTLMHLAASSGLEVVVKRLLDRGVPAETYNSFGMTPLHLACHFGHGKVVDVLLKHGCSPMTLGPGECTSLHIAAQVERY